MWLLYRLMPNGLESLGLYRNVNAAVTDAELNLDMKWEDAMKIGYALRWVDKIEVAI